MALAVRLQQAGHMHRQAGCRLPHINSRAVLQVRKAASSVPDASDPYDFDPSESFGLPGAFGQLPPHLEQLRTDIIDMRWRLEMEYAPDVVPPPYSTPNTSPYASDTCSSSDDESLPIAPLPSPSKETSALAQQQHLAATDLAWAQGFAAICLMEALTPAMSGPAGAAWAGAAVLLHWSSRNQDPLL